MATSEIALFGYVIWTLVLGFGLVGARTHEQIASGRKANSFLADGSDLGVIGQRITRAHGNSMEWLGMPATLLLYAIVSGQTAITDPLALVALGGRIGQTTTHMLSTSAGAVSVRGLFLGVQNVVWVIWIVQLLNASLYH